MGTPGLSRRLLQCVGALALLGAVGAGAVVMVMIRGGLSARDEPSSLEALLARTVRRASIPDRMRALRSPIEATPPLIASAGIHWAGHCAICHANDGSGRTPIGALMFPRAPDLRGGPTQRLTDGELYATIKEGVRLSGMPAWGEPGDADGESWGLVAFIRHLPQLSAAELRELERNNPKTPHQLAEEREEEDFLRGKPVDPQSHTHQEHLPP